MYRESRENPKGAQSQLKCSKCDCQSGSWIAGQDLAAVSAVMLVIIYFPFLLSFVPVNSCVLLAREVFAVSITS